MPRRWVLLNVLLAGLALWFAVELVREIARPRPLPSLQASARVSAPQRSPAVEPVRESKPATGLRAYSVIAARNLFNAGRTDAAAAATAAPGGPKPTLHGVVVDGDKSRAYLEDPLAKRVFGYAVGDNVAGGRLEQIRDDRVVIRRPEGVLEVLLQDPAKPRAAPPVASPAAPQPAAGAPSAPTAPAQVTGPAPQPPDGQRVETPAAPPGPRRPPGARGPILQ